MGSRFILASASPRRKEILTKAGLKFDVIAAEIDETPHADESPENYVLRLSLEKAKKIGGPLPVLGADTVVSINSLLLGKPANAEEALQMLKRLVGHTHLVHTGVSVVSPAKQESVFTATEVKFINASEADLTKYIETGEPFDKAGGYGIQGQGAFLVESINGSYSGVVGLPIEESLVLLKKFGIAPSI